VLRVGAAVALVAAHLLCVLTGTGEAAVAARASSVADAPAQVTHVSGDPFPMAGQFDGLHEAFTVYRRIAESGGWDELPTTRPMRQGNRNVDVPLVRARLAAEPGSTLRRHHPYPTFFDAELDVAVRDFQRRHGLRADGVVGQATIDVLNVPARERARQIATNLDRHARLWGETARRHVVVNIASAELYAIEDGRTVDTMRVIVGSARHQTPALSSKLTHFVLNPYWNVPRGIAVRSILPQIQNDPEYIATRGFQVYQGAGSGRIDPASIDWAELSPRRFPYRLRQDPGPENALGRIKFIFPNEYAVYLHDTPKRAEFVRSVRTRSNGCVRVQDPFRLASFLMGSQSGWTNSQLMQRVTSGNRRVVLLPESVPVHLAYFTVWVDARGEVHFRDDIYRRDHTAPPADEPKPAAPSDLAPRPLLAAPKQPVHPDVDDTPAAGGQPYAEQTMADPRTDHPG